MPALKPFVVDLAGLTIALASERGDWPAALRPRYGAFRSAREPRFLLRLVGRERPRGAAALARLAAEPVTIECCGARVAVRSASLAADLDLAAGRGTLAAPVHRHGVDVALRALLTLADERALLLHGALAADGGRAFACAGSSGAGKSTLAGLLGRRALCDELLLLRRGEEGWSAHALPYWHGRPGGGRLAGIRILSHGVRHALRVLAPADALRRLATEVVWPSFSPPASERTLGLLERLLLEVPVAALAFRPDAGVWPVLAGEAEA